MRPAAQTALPAQVGGVGATIIPDDALTVRQGGGLWTDRTCVFPTDFSEATLPSASSFVDDDDARRACSYKLTGLRPEIRR